MSDETTYDDWLADALANGELGIHIDDKSKVNAYATRFNGDIAQIVAEHGEHPVGKAIWHIYGVGSGCMWDVLDSSLGGERLHFMESVKTLYVDGFMRFCSNHFGNTDSGPEPSRPLNSACYMLWDMDGIECPAINGDTEMLDSSLDVLGFALNLDHLACQESALHGLGHLAHSYREITTPIIRDYLRRAKPNDELRQYAKNAIVAYVL